VDEIDYDAFGNIVSETSPANRGLYAYTGREFDVETQLQFNRARYYDATTGRWISQDPLGFDAGDSNLYRYVNNMPTVATDPSGMELFARASASAKDIVDWLSNNSAGYFGKKGSEGPNIATMAIKLKEGGYRILPVDQDEVIRALKDPRWNKSDWTRNLLESLISDSKHRIVTWKEQKGGTYDGWEFYSNTTTPIAMWEPPHMRKVRDVFTELLKDDVKKQFLDGKGQDDLKLLNMRHDSYSEWISFIRGLDGGRYTGVVQYHPSENPEYTKALHDAIGDGLKNSLLDPSNNVTKNPQDFYATNKIPQYPNIKGITIIDSKTNDWQVWHEASKEVLKGQMLELVENIVGGIPFGTAILNVVMAFQAYSNGDKERYESLLDSAALSAGIDLVLLGLGGIGKPNLPNIGSKVTANLDRNLLAIRNSRGRGLCDAIRTMRAHAREPFSRVLNMKSCFAAGTELLTPEGTKPIQEFRPGDLVLARSEHDSTGPVEAKVVEETFQRLGRVWHVHAGGKVIRTSAEHPFYVHGNGWIEANRLQLGDNLSSDDGQLIAVEEVYDTGEYETLYNVRVAEYQTYFVSGNEWGFSVWAHNTDCFVVPHGNNRFALRNTQSGAVELGQGGQGFASRADALTFAGQNGITVVPFRTSTLGQVISPTDVCVYRGGTTFQVRPGEIRVGNDGLVRTTHGLSVNTNPLDQNVARRTAMRIKSIPDELQIIRRGGGDTHFEIVPKQPMTPERFQELLNQIVLEAA